MKEVRPEDGPTVREPDPQNPEPTVPAAAAPVSHPGNPTTVTEPTALASAAPAAFALHWSNKHTNTHPQWTDSPVCTACGKTFSFLLKNHYCG